MLERMESCGVRRIEINRANIHHNGAYHRTAVPVPADVIEETVYSWGTVANPQVPSDAEAGAITVTVDTGVSVTIEVRFERRLNHDRDITGLSTDGPGYGIRHADARELVVRESEIFNHWVGVTGHTVEIFDSEIHDNNMGINIRRGVVERSVLTTS